MSARTTIMLDGLPAGVWVMGGKKRVPRKTTIPGLESIADEVIHRISEASGIEAGIISSYCRDAGGYSGSGVNVILARFCCYRAIMELTGASAYDTGNAFGRSHPAVRNGLFRLKAWEDTDQKAAVEIQRLVKAGKGEA